MNITYFRWIFCCCTLPNQIFKTVIGVGLLPNLALLHLSEWFMAHEFWFEIFVVSISYGMVSTFSTEIPFQFPKTNFFPDILHVIPIWRTRLTLILFCIRMKLKMETKIAYTNLIRYEYWCKYFHSLYNL